MVVRGRNDQFNEGPLAVNFWEYLEYLEEEIGPIDILPLLNATVYLAGTSYLGSPFWKAACVAVFLFIATKCHYERRTLIKTGVVMALVVTPFWLGLTPPPNELIAMARSVHG
jgi:hypothetical protein